MTPRGSSPECGRLLFAVPILILFVYLQRRAVSGLTAGAVKG
ncbi:hypothetical protein STENM223S_02055 [Streptomyces tendae]